MSAAEFDDSEIAVITSPEVIVYEQGLFTFFVYIHKYDFTRGLRLYIVQNNEIFASDKNLLETFWVSAGEWQKHSVCLPTGNYKIHLVTEVLRTVEYIALANTSFSEYQACNTSFTLPDKCEYYILLKSATEVFSLSSDILFS